MDAFLSIDRGFPNSMSRIIRSSTDSVGYTTVTITLTLLTLRRSEAKYGDRVGTILNQLLVWKEERLPPPRVNQSKV